LAIKLRVHLQPCGLDARHRRRRIVIRGAAGDIDCTEQLACLSGRDFVAAAARGDLASKDFEGGTCLEDGERQRFKVHLAGASERGREGFLGSWSSMGICWMCASFVAYDK
jgi:hypothetical protein